MLNREVGRLASMPIITSPWMTTGELVKRSLWERLFSFPWRPWRSEKWIKIPRQDVMIVKGMFGNYAFCHPAIEAEVKERLEKAMGLGPLELKNE